VFSFDWHILATAQLLLQRETFRIVWYRPRKISTLSQKPVYRFAQSLRKLLILPGGDLSDVQSVNLISMISRFHSPFLIKTPSFDLVSPHFITADEMLSEILIFM
jgi:hypothetical protein